MEWKKVTAAEYCTRVTDGTHDSPKPQSEGRYLITSKHLANDGIDFSKAYKIKEEDYQKIIIRSNVEQYDILFSMIGTIGNLYQEKASVVDYAVKNMAIFKCGGDLLKSQWLYYWLKSPEAQAYIHSSMAGSTQGYLTLDSLRKFPILVPDIDSQRRIAAILSSLDAQIENNNRINRNLEAQAQALFKSWFVDFEPWGGVMPEGWREVSLDEMTSKFGTGLNPRKNFVLGQGTNYYVTIKNMGNNRIYLDDKCDKIDDEAIQKINKRSKLCKGDLLFSGIGTIGRVAFVDETPSNWNTSESVFNMHPKEGFSSNFLYLLLLSDKFQNYVHIHAQGGVQQGIRMASLKAFTMYVPNTEILNTFEDKIAPILQLIRYNHKANDNLASLRDTLLPKLMKGEIGV